MGTYPIIRRLFRHPVGEINPMVEGALKAFYEKSKEMHDIDRIAVILAKYNYFQQNDYEIGKFISETDGTVLLKEAGKRVVRHAKVSLAEFEKEGILRKKDNFQIIKEKIFALLEEKQYTAVIGTLLDNVSTFSQMQKAEAYTIISLTALSKKITALPNGKAVDIEYCLGQVKDEETYHFFIDFYRHIQNEDYIKAYKKLDLNSATSKKMWSSLRNNKILQRIFVTNDVLVFIKEQCNLKASLSKFLKIENEQMATLQLLVSEMEIIIEVSNNL